MRHIPIGEIKFWEKCTLESMKCNSSYKQYYDKRERRGKGKTENSQ